MSEKSHALSHPRHSGFTLVELSVVLAIIALLIGGIIAGQYMIRRTQVQAVAVELGKYQNAYNQFKNQYSGLPGNITDATSYWGTDPDGCPSHANRIPKQATCDGSGSGYIVYGAGGCAAPTAWPESFRAWQHLANAGLIDGRFTGVAGSAGSSDAVIGENIPASQLATTGYGLVSWGNHVSGSACSTNIYPAYYGTTLIVGARRTNNLPLNGALTAHEARNLDSKLDDGKPAAGIMLTFKSAINPGCATSDTPASAEYSTNQTRVCGLAYILESY